jgi:N-methylhydantoinase A
MTVRIGIDIGGTFTDLVAILDSGAVRTVKTPSTPQDYAIGIAHGLAALLHDGQTQVDELLHATTIGSNTILENKIARTALITTRGFRDVLEIRDLRMPRLYDINWTKPEPLVPRHLRLEVAEKLRPDGSVAMAIDAASIEAAIDIIERHAVQSVAICLLHSYANPAHEIAVAHALRARLPEMAISLSHEILPEIKEYPRTSTTVVNAAIQPVVRAYLCSLRTRLDAIGVAAPVRLMQSNGGLASARHAGDFPAQIVESGPAAGVVGAAVLATRLDERQVITFDMGGTTAKAGLVEHGQVMRTEAMEVGGGVMAGARLLVGGGYMLKLPAIDLAEVGAGGGSICRIDPGGAPKVGPQSAGADPGPVCYGRGGTQPTITDCNLALGYLDPAGLAGGSLLLDRDAAVAAIDEHLARPMRLSVQEAACGMLAIASATMMRAIRSVSVERGRDVRACSMMAFGGNGPLFAASIARELGIKRVIIPPMPGLFSAFGLLLADTEHHLSRSFRARVDLVSVQALERVVASMRHTAAGRLGADGFGPDRQRLQFSAMARYVGQSSEIPVPLGDITPAAMVRLLPEAFGMAHEQAYGFRAPAGEGVEMTSLTLLARGLSDTPRLPACIPPPPAVAPAGVRHAWFPGAGWIATPVVCRAQLSDVPRAGPLIMMEYDATCLVPPGATARRDAFGNVVLNLTEI